MMNLEKGVHMPSILEIQRALKSRGFDPGPLDGINGRKTIGAIVSFQAKHGLAVDGIAGPKTCAILFGAKSATVDLADPVWLAEARRKMGLHETRNRSALMAWLKSDGRTLGDPSRLPWCGDFVETAIALTLPAEPLPANPYLARNWLKFGGGLAVPAPGAVLVFWRGAKSGTSGHVGFYVGEDADAFHVLGGNQSNAVTIARLDKGRLLGVRWPSTAPAPARGRVFLNVSGSPLSINEA